MILNKNLDIRKTNQRETYWSFTDQITILHVQLFIYKNTFINQLNLELRILVESQYDISSYGRQ